VDARVARRALAIDGAIEQAPCLASPEPAIPGAGQRGEGGWQGHRMKSVSRRT